MSQLLSELDLGSLPDWLAAIGTIGAFAVALMLLTREINTRREWESQARQAQARLIFAHLLGRAGQVRSMIEVEVHNRSEEPIYDLVAYLTDGRGIKKSHRFGEIVPGSHRFGIDIGAELDRMPSTMTIDVYFLDAKGFSWHRSSRGIIEPLDPSNWPPIAPPS